MQKINISADDVLKADIIEFRKIQSDLIKKARAAAKHDTCLLCGKKQPVFAIPIPYHKCV